MVFLSLGLGPQFLSHKAAISNILLFLCLKEHNFQSLSCHNTCEMFLQPLWPTLQPQNISRRDLQIVMVINVVCCINVSLMSRHMLCFLLYVVCRVVLSFCTVYLLGFVRSFMITVEWDHTLTIWCKIKKICGKW